MRPISITRTLTAGAVGAVCASQTPAGAGNLLINGTLAAAGVATIGPPQRSIAINPGAVNMSAVTFTVTGTDETGGVITETITGPNAVIATSALSYVTVTKIAVSAAPGGALTVDTSAVGASQIVPMNQYVTPFNVSISFEITAGAGNWTLQYTLDNVFDGTGGPYVWYNHSALVNIVANTNGTIISPVTAVRVLTNSGTGTLATKIVQAGLIA